MLRAPVAVQGPGDVGLAVAAAVVAQLGPFYRIALAVGGSWTSNEDEDQRPTGRPKAGSVDPTSAPETRAEAIHARERAEARRTSGSGETKIGQRERTMQIKLAPGPPKLPPKPAPPQGPRKRREV